MVAGRDALPVGATVYVTGANGAMGTEVSTYLRTLGWKVRTVSRMPIDGDADNIISANIFDPDEWLPHTEIDAPIIHLAGLANPRANNASEDELHELHTSGHARMAGKLAARGWQGRLIYSSSGGTVYGNPSQSPIPETHACNPISFYGRHKLAVETMLAETVSTPQDRLFILRIANLYGSRKAKANQGVIPIIADHILNGRPFPIFGDGTATRDYVHVHDISSAIHQCLVAPQDHGGIYNIGSGKGVALNTLIQAIEVHIGKNLDIRYEPAGVNVSANVLDNRKALGQLGWAVKHEVIEDILRGNAGI